ncbi:hypothetical protein A2291_03170 [candidate division WOR-1 bacterium RIFOXYB2_FULL_42_35]|uniref:Uncharacterized protein n=1 Tax=candidate division WOR-1 bacterium RIFOXYC2_FULL_41_25 TaxID=1802586 RepID=A0A1F4TIV7_UNCSA|nr:MAG: hypothetical protein A2247_02245 [candidate division WOR-1 bacterium RIFOXYA2_FULL_41_14]OGC21559.1 MAG: hypothetical protein A2291_03170 [candidate division WOR-1 bacterium RIFOXYB2_FULL_42_35]OGC32537.1 MAG: hypothetical protein A2462_02880 [candidate division WOR-1 bacterium RIFOXYC2_FULL_41_25]
MEIKRISDKELRKLKTLGGKVSEAPPTGIAPVLRASWNFAQNMSQRFNRELKKDRFKEMLSKLAKRFI